MAANAFHILHDALFQIGDRVPLDEMSVHRAGPIADLMPPFFVDSCGFQAVVEESGHDVVCEQLHTAVAMVNYEPLLCSQKLV